MNSFSKSTDQIITSFCLLLIHLQFFFILLMSITSQCHGCQEHERRALLDFKSSLGDPSDRLSSWKQGNQNENCCRWYGIRCSPDTSHVISIDLRNRELEHYIHAYLDGTPPNNVLHGKLSPSLSNLTNLVYLDLSWNDFHESQIPLQLSHLTKLTHLDLSYSNFSASISRQFANLTSLSYLDLSCTEDSTSCPKLSSAEWLRGLENLKVLSLSGIDLSKATSSQKSFAEHISYLSHLEYLDISFCSISATFVFPLHDFHNLSRLSTLIMNHNPELTSGIPVEIVNLTSLSILDLSDCGLQGSVPSFTQLTELHVSYNWDLRLDLTRMFQHQWPKLQTLSIDRTNVSGPIPISILNASSLVIFNAGGCSIQGSIPSWIGKLSRLQSISLFNNNITGTIPISICEMSSLQELYLDSNNISGTIPSCLTKLHNLTVFSVFGNSIGGSVLLIKFINELNLTRLDLSSNKLTVVIDQRYHLYSKFKLEYLSLSSCNLKGAFPAFICKSNNLIGLDLSRNHLAGVIPFNCFSEHQTSWYFYLSNNKLDGPLPLPPLLPLGSFGFDLSNNKFSGEISTEIGKRLSSFVSLSLADNELSGPIPSSMFPNDSVVTYNVINLSNNKFSGQIPFSICSKKSDLFIIDISNNKLSGIIPTSIGYCTGLTYLNLGNNNLTGNVPNELQQVIGLNNLQLNDNNLHGTPLDFISKLQHLHVLNLANNHFGGSIPHKFGSLQYLHILSLRLNNFNGSIPEDIVHLEHLQILDLSENNLSGLIPGKIGNLVMLRSRPKDDIYSLGRYPNDVQLHMVIKGIMIKFEKLYAYSSGIDLSCNILEGNIPDDIGLLKGLSTLNLSHNHISGVIPKSVGNMSGLESLDLSFNKLSGNIPQSLASMSSLAKLNLSYNNLSGRIPREPHFDTLDGDGSAYANNSLLCGVYTDNTCEDDQRTNAIDTNSPSEGYQEDAQAKLLLYAIVALGFGVGFWGLFFILLLKKEKWWFGYWRLVDIIAARVANCLLKS